MCRFIFFLLTMKTLTIPHFQVLNEKISLLTVTSTIIGNFPFLVSENRRKEKPGMNRSYRAYSHACPITDQIYKIID